MGARSRDAAQRVDRAAEAIVAAMIIVYRALMVARDQHHRTVLDPAKVVRPKMSPSPADPPPPPATRKAWDSLGRIGWVAPRSLRRYWLGLVRHRLILRNGEWLHWVGGEVG